MDGYLNKLKAYIFSGQSDSDVKVIDPDKDPELTKLKEKQNKEAIDTIPPISPNQEQLFSEDVFSSIEGEEILSSIENEEMKDKEKDKWKKLGFNDFEFSDDGKPIRISLKNAFGNRINYIDNDTTNYDTYKLDNKLNEYIDKYATKYDIDPKFLKALAIGEQSGSDKISISRDDNYKRFTEGKTPMAVGPFQIYPGPTDNNKDGLLDYDENRYNNGLDMYNLENNVELGAKMMASFLKRAKKFNGDQASELQNYSTALSAYNMGPGYVFNGMKPSKKKIEWNNMTYGTDSNKVGYMDKIISIWLKEKAK